MKVATALAIGSPAMSATVHAGGRAGARCPRVHRVVPTHHAHRLEEGEVRGAHNPTRERLDEGRDDAHGPSHERHDEGRNRPHNRGWEGLDEGRDDARNRVNGDRDDNGGATTTETTRVWGTASAVSAIGAMTCGDVC